MGWGMSGGGARAMAFHLGCLRALHDRGLLSKVRVLSTVSGGSVAGACYAYSAGGFDNFDAKLIALLRTGLTRSIVLNAIFSLEVFKILATILVSGFPTLLLRLVGGMLVLADVAIGVPTRRLGGWCVTLSQRLPVWGSLTTALEKALESVFDYRKIGEVARPGLQVVINACDLKTGTAFRFGSQRSGGWRYGRLVSDQISVAKAVAASAAFPVLLPPLVETFDFEKKGTQNRHSVILTDGGVIDNLGVSVLEPGRDGDITDRYPATHIISLNAGPGQFEESGRPFWWGGRVVKAFETVHRKSQDQFYSRLHRYVEAGQLQGFGMIYLGQQDERLPYRPADFVTREQVRLYPTDFSPMSGKNIFLLTSRGEQLTHLIIDRYLADL
jgi:NTE family protein